MTGAMTGPMSGPMITGNPPTSGVEPRVVHLRRLARRVGAVGRGCQGVHGVRWPGAARRGRSL
jgi:hypothetical protein